MARFAAWFFSALVITAVLYYGHVPSAGAAQPYLPEGPASLATPTVTPTSINTPTPTRTRTPTPTRTPIPTRTPTPKPCVYEMNTVLLGGSGLPAQIKILTDYASQAQCLLNAIADAEQQCQAWVRKPGSAGALYLDNCIVESYFLCPNCASFLTGYAIRPKVPVPPVTRHSGNTHTFLFNSNCQGLSSVPAGMQKCSVGTLFYMTSPLSLLWGDRGDLPASPTVVQFPLDPGQSGRWYLWYASAEAPLLVYDPRHEGHITSGQQLFGNFTFGGKRGASRVGLGREAGPWRDGFEALATLDADGDGQVSGKELAPLGLWFDKNRDAVADEGEVVAVSDTGVSALFYRPDRHEQGRITATVGYQRSVDGRQLQGAAVDWFAESGTSQFELMSKILAIANDSPAGSADPAPAGENGKTGDPRAPDINDVWLWRTTDPRFGARQANGMGGILIFSDPGKGTISGHSFAEFPLRPESGAFSMAQLFALQGSRERTADGKDQIRFRIDLDSQNSIESRAVVVDDKTLEGSTTAEVLYRGESIKFSYPWQAKRFRSK